MGIKNFLISSLAVAGIANAAAINKTPLKANKLEERGCAPVHVIVARGTTEPAGEGSMGSLADAITSQVPGSDSVGLDYPATWDYNPSELEGHHNMVSSIKSYVDACPDSKIVLMGYSQGAQVVMDSLCGSSEDGWTWNTHLPKKYGKNIHSAVVYGDPSHVAGMPWNKGSATLPGMVPRQHNHACAPYADRIASFCDANDPVCASGSDINVHTSYMTTTNSMASSWLMEKLG